MYCQHCGTQLPDEKARARRCAACGKPVHAPGRVPWPGLLLALLVALLVMVAIQLRPARTTPGAAKASGASPAADRALAVATTAAAAPQQPARLPREYVLPTRYGDIGPRLIAAGAIDRDRFVATYERAGRPLGLKQLAILDQGSDEAIAINQDNAYFLLNLFWALGLVNDNPILTEGLMMTASDGDPGRFASVGGWTIGRIPPTDLYASADLVLLTEEQQAWVTEVAGNVYRPCCNNHTAFADCNHGMALLGLLELMAGQGASIIELYDAAKYVSAFWFPQQAAETALFFAKSMNLEYTAVDPRMAVGPEVFSSTGFRQVHQWLVDNNALLPAPGGGNSCGV